MKDRFVVKRYWNIALILLVSMIGIVVVSLVHGKYMDEIAVYLMMAFVFMAAFLFLLEYQRKHKGISHNKEATFRRVLYGYLISWLIAVGCSFMPEFLKPVIAIAFVMTAFSSSMIAMCVGIFFDAILCLILGCNMPELVLCVLFTLFGSIFSEAMEEGKNKIWYELVVLAISTMLPPLIYYLTYQENNSGLFIYGALEGLVLDLFLHFFYLRAVHAKESEVPNLLEDMLDETYPLNRELKKFSKADYEHAKRVSNLSRKCAHLVGADETICAVAGFFYRIGILEGESIVAGGVKLAQRECFPEEIIRIISEYNGEEVLPTTIESAIVQMVDSLVKKIELFDSDMMSSDWNQNMVIYQTLNDFSAKGLYDNSGLSMNMFLKIREYLVNEEALV